MENRAAVLHAPHKVSVESRPVPEPGPLEVLVEIRAVGVCGSDVHYYEHGRIGEYVVTDPLVLGHEPSGVVAAQGRGATRHPVGTRVALEPGVPCGRCRQCREGRYNLCPDVAFFATPPIDGVFSTYGVIHEDFAHPIPDSISDAAGALLEPLSVALWAVRKGGVAPGDRVLVTGAGPVGLLTAQVARLAGAAEVIVTDMNPSRLAVAERFGADQVVDVSQKQLGTSMDADVLLECSGAPPAVTAGIVALRPGGTAVLVGMGPAAEATLPVQLIQNHEITLTGTFRYANTYPAAIALAASGRIDLDALVTGQYPLDRTEDALRAARTDPTVIKPIVVPGA
jgi:L-iditol 2-dehydrogenase